MHKPKHIALSCCKHLARVSLRHIVYNNPYIDIVLHYAHVCITQHGNVHNIVTLFVMQVVALDCLLQRHSTSSLPLPILSTLVQLAVPFCFLLFFVVFFCVLHIAAWHKAGANPGWHTLSRQLKVSTYAVLGFFYTSLTQASLNQFSCYEIDYPIPTNTPYPYFLQVSHAAPAFDHERGSSALIISIDQEQSPAGVHSDKHKTDHVRRTAHQEAHDT